jgi:hypothetical protein
MNENVPVFLDKAFDCLADAAVLIEKDRFVQGLKPDVPAGTIYG